MGLFQSHEEREVTEKGIQGSEREVLGCTSGVKPVKIRENPRKPRFRDGAGHKIGKSSKRQKGKKR